MITQVLTGAARGFGRASRVCLYLAIGTERLARFREGVELMWGDPWPAAGDGGSLFPIERELELCEIALREQGRSATLVRDFFEDARVSGPFDAVVFSYFCYSYVPESARRIACLRKAAGLLAPGGRIFVSVVVMDGPHPILPRLARLSAAITGSDWRVEAGDAVSLRRDGMPRPCFFLEHVFTGVEILEEIGTAGMEVIHPRAATDYPWIVCAAP